MQSFLGKKNSQYDLICIYVVHHIFKLMIVDLVIIVLFWIGGRNLSVINRKHRMAELASRESTRLHALLFFKNKVLTEEAYVTAVRSNGFSVIVPR
jgi:hypothetical protein